MQAIHLCRNPQIYPQFKPNSPKKKKNVPEKHHVEPKQSVLFLFFFERMLAGYF